MVTRTATAIVRDREGTAVVLTRRASAIVETKRAVLVVPYADGEVPPVGPVGQLDFSTEDNSAWIAAA
jgi:hypothetical protein